MGRYGFFIFYLFCFIYSHFSQCIRFKYQVTVGGADDTVCWYWSWGAAGNRLYNSDTSARWQVYCTPSPREKTPREAWNYFTVIIHRCLYRNTENWFWKSVNRLSSCCCRAVFLFHLSSCCFKSALILLHPAVYRSTEIITTAQMNLMWGCWSKWSQFVNKMGRIVRRCLVSSPHST